MNPYVLVKVMYIKVYIKIDFLIKKFNINNKLISNNQ
jgi:hypothetical protein